MVLGVGLPFPAVTAVDKLQPRFAGSRRTPFSSAPSTQSKSRTRKVRLLQIWCSGWDCSAFGLPFGAFGKFQPRFAGSRRTHGFSSLPYTKKADHIDRPLNFGARGGIRTHTGFDAHKALNLACLPISPPEQLDENRLWKIPMPAGRCKR